VDSYSEMYPNKTENVETGEILIRLLCEVLIITKIRKRNYEYMLIIP